MALFEVRTTKDKDGKKTGLLPKMLIAAGVMAAFMAIADSADGSGYAGQTAAIRAGDTEAKLHRIEGIIDRDFYFRGAIDHASIEEAFRMEDDPDKGFRAAVGTLGDAYSRYLTGEEREESWKSDAGIYSGVGITVEKRELKDAATVTHVIRDGPADAAGIRAGDDILAVDGRDAAPLDIREITELVRGEPGTDVALTLERDGRKYARTLGRRDIRAESVTGMMLEDDTGMIRITSFNNDTHKEFAEAATALSGEGMERLVLDLRDNGGGLLDACAEVADEFLDEGVITRIKDADGHTQCYRARRGRTVACPTAVLVSGGSASASEMLAGALRDNGAATVIGETTYGKGTVQSEFPIGDGSALRLTTAAYYLPGGESVQDAGIKPDVEIPDTYDGPGGDLYDYKGDPMAMKAIETLHPR